MGGCYERKKHIDGPGGAAAPAEMRGQRGGADDVRAGADAGPLCGRIFCDLELSAGGRGGHSKSGTGCRGVKAETAVDKSAAVFLIPLF